MTNHLLNRFRMSYFHMVVLCLLLIYPTDANDIDEDRNYLISPCSGAPFVHQTIVVINKIGDDRVIRLDDSSCRENYKLSLVIVPKRSSYGCAMGESLRVEYIENGDFEVEDYWGCRSQGYHAGDSHMEVKYILDNAKEFRISRNGNWSMNSIAFLVATAYYETNGNCDDGFFNCDTPQGCPVSKKRKNKSRCISNDLTCDDHPSCGRSCNEDEANEVCHKPFRFDWGDFQYIVTTFLAALFFILSPTVIVFLLFYRKRMRIRELQQRLELEREVRAARERSMLPTISNRINDNPPTYEDVHETIEPPPCFCAAIALNNTINRDKAAEAEGTTDTEINFECTCNNSNKV